MSRFLRAVGFIIFAGIVLVLFGRYPSFPIPKNVRQVTITYVDFGKTGRVEKEYILTASQIEELRRVCRPVWLDVYPLGSTEGLPRWVIETKDSEWETEHFLVDEDEFNGSIRPPKKLLRLLQQKYR